MDHKKLVVFFGALGIGQAYFIAGRLPATAATHFDISGAPNGWMSPSLFFWFMVGMYAIMTSAFTLVPVSMMNIPHKDYWLSPERREETTKGILRDYGTMGIVSQFFLMMTSWMVYAANTARPPRLQGAFLVFVLAFIAYTIIWSIKFHRRFRR